MSVVDLYLKWDPDLFFFCTAFQCLQQKTGAFPEKCYSILQKCNICHGTIFLPMGCKFQYCQPERLFPEKRDEILTGNDRVRHIVFPFFQGFFHTLHAEIPQESFFEPEGIIKGEKFFIKLFFQLFLKDPADILAVMSAVREFSPS